MKTFLITIGVIILIAILSVGSTFLGFANTYITNRVNYVNQKIEDSTSYETIKSVEDTCRAYIASYNSDKLTYEQYKDSDNSEKQSWAEQAKMRANKSAVSYNEYILKNSFVFEGNIPSDITSSLAIIK